MNSTPQSIGIGQLSRSDLNPADQAAVIAGGAVSFAERGWL